MSIHTRMASIQNRVAVLQNVRVLPPREEDEESLPESAPPTPCVNLLTEDEETDVEARSPTLPPQLFRLPPVRTTPESVSQSVAPEAGPSSATGEPMTQPLQPARRILTRPSGKNMRALAASVRSPPRSPAEGEEEEDFILACDEEERRREAEERRREAFREKVMNAIPHTERRKDAAAALVERTRREYEEAQEELARYERELERMRSFL